MTQTGWHFLRDDRRLAYPPHERVEVGYALHVDQPLKLCHRGLHWSRRPIDALQYAPGNTICYVETWGEMLHDEDKSVSEYRRVLWMHNAERLLWQFVCDVAEDSLLEHEVTYPASWAAIKLRREWLAGRVVTAREWTAAWYSAWDAAIAAAWAAAKGAAWAAASAAARDADRDVARAAARISARAAARISAGAAAKDVARVTARAAAWAHARAAAKGAARAAARVAARDAYNDRLCALLVAQMRRDGVI